MSASLFNRYIWLVNTISRRGKISLEEINECWRISPYNESHDTIPERTFHRHKEAIKTLFDVDIKCDRSDSNRYYIANEEELENNYMRKWLLGTFAVDQLSREAKHLKGRILFEDIPSGQQYLEQIIEAMRDNRTLRLHYRTFGDSFSNTEVEPYCVKVYARRCCDETSAAVVRMENGHREILSNIVASQIDVHRLYGGVVPEIASRAHIEAISRITYEALDEAGVTLSDIGAVAVTAFPGLIGALIVGVNFAKSLAFANDIPLVAVNHVKAHVAAAYLEYPSLEPPFTAMVVSGGHTSIYQVSSYTDFKTIGSTRDDAAGEAFDKVARVLGMPYPGGA
ncbi:MAG: hypothetical protein IIX59_03130, partial [Alistipes sp.]|nr:hypothetical protein [Alistipes sp.]